MGGELLQEKIDRFTSQGFATNNDVEPQGDVSHRVCYFCDDLFYGRGMVKEKSPQGA